MKQAVLIQVFGSLKRTLAGEQGRAADRNRFLAQQPLDRMAGVLASTITDRQIQFAVVEIDGTDGISPGAFNSAAYVPA